MNRRTAFKPFADSYLKALSGTIRSKNPVIRKSYATAIGYVCQLATYDRLVSVIKHLKKLYIDEEGKNKSIEYITTINLLPRHFR
jgi:proteasome component ECM29